MQSKAMEVTMRMVRPVFQQHSLSKDFFPFLISLFQKIIIDIETSEKPYLNQILLECTKIGLDCCKFI